MQAEVWVDFNDLDANGELTTLARFAPPGLTAGTRLHASDDDGTVCEVEVVAVQGDLLRLRVLPGTLRPSSP